jgi:hypothetical protein
MCAKRRKVNLVILPKTDVANKARSKVNLVQPFLTTEDLILAFID